MRTVIWILIVGGCGKSAPKPAEGSAAPPSRPPDDLDEKMRHCPLTVDGAVATYAFETTGTRWEITSSSAAAVEEIQRRAKHVVEFAAGRSEKGVHGGGQGGGRMRNCPVLTSGVVIAETDLPTGARLVVTPLAGREGDALRTETIARAKAFTFPTVTVSETTLP